MRNLRQGMVSIYLAQALATGSIEVKGSLERFRDFIYIDDVVEVWRRAADLSGDMGRALNVGTGVRTTVAALLKRICAARSRRGLFRQRRDTGGSERHICGYASLKACLDIRRFTRLMKD